MNELRERLEDAQIDLVNGQRLPCDAGGDMFEYSVTHLGNTVSMCQDKIPDPLRPLVALLDRIASDQGSHSS
jgi:hypothetical protein